MVNQIKTFSLRPEEGPTGMKLSRDKGTFIEAIAGALNLKKLWVVETEGNDYDTERQQWNSGNNIVAIGKCYHLS